MPAPGAILSSLLLLLDDSLLHSALLETFQNVITASVTSCILGITVGALLGSSRIAANMTEPTLDFLRSVPVTLAVPVVAVILGPASELGFWLLAAYPSALLMTVSVKHGIQNADPMRGYAFFLLGGRTGFHRFMLVTINEAMPQITGGLRIAVSYCIVIVLVLEFFRVGDQQGVGAMIADKVDVYEYSNVYALVTIVAFIGFAINKTIEVVGEWLTAWQRTSH